jgi:hypothetical protein
MIDKSVEACRCVNVNLGHRAIEKVLQRTTRFVLCVEIEQGDQNFIRGEPFGQGNHDAGFSDAALAAHGEDNTL